jgi:hypothetical protein
MFAGAGILWGTITVFRGLELWRRERGRVQFPRVVLVGAALALGCTGYLLWMLLPL